MYFEVTWQGDTCTADALPDMHMVYSLAACGEPVFDFYEGRRHLLRLSLEQVKDMAIIPFAKVRVADFGQGPYPGLTLEESARQLRGCVALCQAGLARHLMGPPPGNGSSPHLHTERN
jgi:hypothetical protein